MSKLRFRPHHEALRDTMWVGKGTGASAVLIAGMLAVAALMAWWMH